MPAVWRLDSPYGWGMFDVFLREGHIVALDNGPTGALICHPKTGEEMKAWKERPVEQPLAAWGDLQYAWRHWGMVGARRVNTIVKGRTFEGSAFLRFRLKRHVLWFSEFYEVPHLAVCKGKLQIYSSVEVGFFHKIHTALLQGVGGRFAYVTSTNKRGQTPARGEQGLIDWAEEWGFPLFLLPEDERALFDTPEARAIADSFCIVEAQKRGFVIRREGNVDMEKKLYGLHAYVDVDLDTK